MRKILALCALIGALGACSGGADENRDGKVSSDELKKEMATGGAMKMTPGLWETTITFKTVDAKALPEAAKTQMLKTMGQGVAVKSCLTAAQTEKPGADFFGSPEGSNCTFDQLDRSGSGMKVSMTCKPEGSIIVRNTMDGSFSGDNYTMDMQQKISGTPMGEMTMTGRIVGKRLGDCPA